MKYPKLRSPEYYRETTDVFLGLNLGSHPGDGEFVWMENLSSDGFPMLSTRKKRGMLCQPDRLQGMIARDNLCYVDGSKFVMDGLPIEMNLSTRLEDCPKRLISMGAYVIILPDRRYINTACITDMGSLDASYTTVGSAELSPADLDGTVHIPDYIQSEEPQEPENMALWLDTSTSPNVLLQWSASAGMWGAYADSYIKISSPGIGAAFRQYDGVTLEGITVEENLNGSTVIWGLDEDYILVPGLLGRVQIQQGSITVTRRMPDMDFVIEAGNRLWGCRYGVSADGTPVNEIYASKLGDFRNWNCFMGLATDSYTASLGADGVFTGAVTHLGYPVFFRENCLHKVYGSYPANFRIQTTACRGIQRGSEGSTAILGDTLFYKSIWGICVYDGSLPVEIPFGQEPYHGAVAGAFGNKYYISMADAGGEYHLFVYDSVRKLWHREDNTHAQAFCACRGQLYFQDGGVIRKVLGDGEESFHWMAETGDLGLGTPDSKYLCRISLRMALERGTKVKIWVRYDEGAWELAAQVLGRELGTVSLPLRLRRCDHLRLKLEGTGEARICSLTKTTELGSDIR